MNEARSRPAVSRNGLARLASAARTWFHRSRGAAAAAAAPPASADPIGYDAWLARHGTLDDAARAAILARIPSLRVRPRFSIVMPVYETPLRWLGAAIASVQKQLYPEWELCMSDDASTLPGLREVLLDFARRDPRIRLHFRETNGHISANSNDALALARGDFVVLLDADDLLPEDTLFRLAEEIEAHPDCDLIYSDEDKVDVDGRRYDPYFKPDWNPALILSQNLFSHLGVYRRSLVERVGGFRIGYEGSQDHDLVLRCADATEAGKIRHIPRILYHWRAVPGSAASADGNDAKPYAWSAGARAIADHLARRGIAGSVSRACMSFYQVDYALPSVLPKVSIVLPTTARLDLLPRCLESLLARTTYPDFEVLVTVDEAVFGDAARAAYLEKTQADARVHVLAYPSRPFNYAWANNWAVRQATGTILCLLNDDVEIETADWLEKFAARLALDRVGAVGALLHYPDGTIQHAGVVLGLGGVAGHAFHHAPRGAAGYFGRAAIEQDLSCVTAACLAIRRDVFEQAGGFNEALAIAFNDVDLCLRLRARGWRILWTPQVSHIHRESQSIGRHDAPARAAQFRREEALMRELWAPLLDADPCYSPNLSLRDSNAGIAPVPRLKPDRDSGRA